MAVTASNALIDELVHQFTDPFAFFRELIQNSIDAGSNRIDVTLAYHPTAKPPLATAVVADWGEGMTRKIIDDFLLTKFRSSKEDDATKIGKYGIGFVSVFACAPDAVTVDTGRDGEFWRVLFKADRSHQLIRLEAPVDGTRVTLHKQMGAKDYDDFAQKSEEAVKKWCRHSEVEVTLCVGAATGAAPPPPLSVREPLAVDAPFQVEHREDGLQIVLGVPRKQPASLGLYNRGLTLLEAHEELVPGLSVKVVSRLLEHTLTRDNVRRDKAFTQVVKKARALAEGPLLRRLPDELRRTAQDSTAWADWRVLFAYAQQRLTPQQLWLRRPEGGALEGAAVLRAVKGQTLWLGARRTPVVERLDAAAIPVIEGLPSDVWVEQIRRLFRSDGVRLADDAWTHAEPVAAQTAPAFSAALTDALRLLRASSQQVALTRLHGACAPLPFALVQAVGKPMLAARAVGSPFEAGAPPTLVLNTAHADIGRLGPLLVSAPRLAALLVARRLAVYFSCLDDRAERTLTGWALT